ncbi:hypothetical protein AAC387_Pa02g1235 [Persea americana]
MGTGEGRRWKSLGEEESAVVAELFPGDPEKLGHLPEGLSELRPVLLLDGNRSEFDLDGDWSISGDWRLAGEKEKGVGLSEGGE